LTIYHFGIACEGIRQSLAGCPTLRAKVDTTTLGWRDTRERDALPVGRRSCQEARPRRSPLSEGIAPPATTSNVATAAPIHKLRRRDRSAARRGRIRIADEPGPMPLAKTSRQWAMLWGRSTFVGTRAASMPANRFCVYSLRTAAAICAISAPTTPSMALGGTIPVTY
jgi:hypothetical protein